MVYAEISDIKVIVKDLGYKNDLCIPEIVSFKLTNGSSALANLLRVFIYYVPTKYLHCSIETIQIREQYDILDKIKKRLELIPITQNVNVGTEVIIKAENKSKDSHFVTSKQIVIAKNNNDICMNDRFRIMEIHPKSEIKINMVVKEHAPNMREFGISLLQSVLEYNILDYKKIKVLLQGTITERLVSTKNNEYDSNALYVVKEEDKSLANNFVGNNGDNEVNKLDEYFSKVIYKKDMELYTTEQVYCRDFSLKYKTYGTMGYKQLFKTAFDNVISIYKNLIIEKNINSTNISGKETYKYKVNTYEHVAVLLQDTILSTNKSNVVMHIEYIGYDTIYFIMENDNIKIIEVAIDNIITLLNKLKVKFQ